MFQTEQSSPFQVVLPPGNIPNMEESRGIQNSEKEVTSLKSQSIQENEPGQIMVNPERKAVSKKIFLDPDCSPEEENNCKVLELKRKFVQTEIHQLRYGDGSPCDLKEENNVGKVNQCQDSTIKFVAMKMLQPIEKEITDYVPHTPKGNIVNQIQQKKSEYLHNKLMPTFIDKFSSFVSLAGKQWQLADPKQKITDSTDKKSSIKVESVSKTNMKGEERIKRPLNAFMVFSHLERRKMVGRKLGLHHSKVSQQLGREWRALGELGRGPYLQEAERLRLLHLQEHPGYKYRPRPRKPSVGITSRKGGSGEGAAWQARKGGSGEGAAWQARKVGSREGAAWQARKVGSREGAAWQATIPHSSLQAAWPWLAAWLKERLPHLRHKALGHLEIVDILTDHIQVSYISLL